ncbi:hypothetical protein BMR1_02g01865 [Babesia microti strain RI]|uniref:Uncharacterized protein n=1 Tax=Babesia microti (strain RI) TaxID=1133968 RepID=I7IQ63_BABMR|nr:hypothetical protein BMR1_02g01865 [Babesia microti strain RI]CCF73530.1 hypothetical protein BMR1_02g01865 [Babesia microti strain RI]|eukprot:XP_012648139.1 hypothetical protein BMR1_02g01865 [Babesia microti strain RI]
MSNMRHNIALLMSNLPLLLLLITSAFSADIKICINDGRIHCFVYVIALTDDNVNEESFLSHGEMPDLLNSYEEANVIASNFVDNTCKTLKISGIGKISVKVWPFVSTTEVANLDQLNIPASFDKVHQTIDIIDANAKETITFNVSLGYNSVSGSIIVSGGQIDHKSLLVGAMNEFNHTFVGKVASDFTYQVNNLPKGNYRIFPIKLDTIVHIPKEAKIFCSNYYVKEPHHSCIYTHSYNSGIDRLNVKSTTMRSEIDYLNQSLNVTGSINNVDLDIFGNPKDSTISLILKSNRSALYTVELHEFIGCKNSTKKVAQSITRMENIDFHGLKEGKYLVQVWLSSPGINSTDVRNSKSGLMSETTVSIKPYGGTTYIGIDFDLLHKDKSYVGEDDLIFNAFVEFLIRIFGRIPVHIMCWGLLIYGLRSYYGDQFDNFVNMKIRSLLMQTSIKNKKDNKKNK